MTLVWVQKKYVWIQIQSNYGALLPHNECNTFCLFIYLRRNEDTMVILVDDVMMMYLFKPVIMGSMHVCQFLLLFPVFSPLFCPFMLPPIPQV